MTSLDSLAEQRVVAMTLADCSDMIVAVSEPFDKGCRCYHRQRYPPFGARNHCRDTSPIPGPNAVIWVRYHGSGIYEVDPEHISDRFALASGVAHHFCGDI